jgi:hypothetical protein
VKFPVSVFFLRDRQQSASKKEGTMKIGVLTGGGDCPGLNAAIRAIVKYGSKRYEDRFLGIALRVRAGQEPAHCWGGKRL